MCCWAAAGADTLIGGALNDTIDGHAGDDLLNLAAGGVDTAAGGNGNDRIDFGTALTAADQVSGGSGTDELILNGDYSAGITLGASTITSVEVITLEHGFSYTLTGKRRERCERSHAYRGWKRAGRGPIR